MRQFPIPTAEHRFEYLLRLYFGFDSDPLSCCIGRAYRDMNRTIHGFAQVPEGEELRARASSVVRSFLTTLADPGGAGLDQAAFDERHRIACDDLCSTYAAAGFNTFRIGQAQKWLNMALKYVFTFGEERLPGFTRLFGFAHFPLDNVIMDRLRSYGVPRLATPWSRIEKHEDYMVIQRWMRARFPDSAPLAVEFALWQEAGRSASTSVTSDNQTTPGQL